MINSTDSVPALTGQDRRRIGHRRDRLAESTI
jgi:hypothetical protein